MPAACDGLGIEHPLLLEATEARFRYSAAGSVGEGNNGGSRGQEGELSGVLVRNPKVRFISGRGRC